MRGGKVLYESLLGLSADGSPGHTTRLLEEVERAADAAGGWEQVQSIAVGLGPGSFTGLRVGIASARALAASRGLSLAGVCTLDALAQGLAEAAGEGRSRLAVLDARRGEAFAALYGPSGERVWGPGSVRPLSSAAGSPSSPTPRWRPDRGRYDFVMSLKVGAPRFPVTETPSTASTRGTSAPGGGGECGGNGGEPLVPIYLRPPDAERWRERDGSKAED